MWSHRPRYDDTFGVPMDLGADRMDPLSPKARPPGPGRHARPQTVLVEKPRPLFGLFGSPPEDNPKPAATERPPRLQSPQARPIDHRPPAHRPTAPQAAPANGFRQLEGFAGHIWKRLSLQHRIVLAIGGAWFLLVTGLFLPAIVIGVFYMVIRNQRRGEA